MHYDTRSQSWLATFGLGLSMRRIQARNFSLGNHLKRGRPLNTQPKRPLARHHLKAESKERHAPLNRAQKRARLKTGPVHSPAQGEDKAPARELPSTP